MSLTQPTALQHAFAYSASGSYINAIPDSPTGSALASWQEGFPPITFVEVAAGGSPPYGADFNGVLNYLSAAVQWGQSGMSYIYDSTFATAIGGYPLGAVVQSNDRKKSWVSLVAANTHDPNTAANIGVYWFPVIGTTAVGFARYAVTSGTANALVLTSSGVDALPATPGATIYSHLYFIPGSNNTGAVTVNVDGAGAVALHRNDDTALAADDLVAGTVYEMVYTGTNWQLVALTQNQINAATTPSLFGAVNDVTASRSLGSTYTNSTGKPMFVSLVASTGGSNGDLGGYVNGTEIIVNSQPNAASAIGIGFIVPSGATYKVAATVGSISSISMWSEMY